MANTHDDTTYSPDRISDIRGHIQQIEQSIALLEEQHDEASRALCFALAPIPVPFRAGRLAVYKNGTVWYMENMRGEVLETEERARHEWSLSYERFTDGLDPEIDRVSETETRFTYPVQPRHGTFSVIYEPVS